MSLGVVRNEANNLAALRWNADRGDLVLFPTIDRHGTCVEGVGRYQNPHHVVVLLDIMGWTGAADVIEVGNLRKAVAILQDAIATSPTPVSFPYETGTAAFLTVFEGIKGVDEDIHHTVRFPGRSGFLSWDRGTKLARMHGATRDNPQTIVLGQWPTVDDARASLVGTAWDATAYSFRHAARLQKTPYTKGIEQLRSTGAVTDGELYIEVNAAAELGEWAKPIVQALERKGVSGRAVLTVRPKASQPVLYELNFGPPVVTVAPGIVSGNNRQRCFDGISATLKRMGTLSNPILGGSWGQPPKAHYAIYWNTAAGHVDLIAATGKPTQHDGRARVAGYVPGGNDHIAVEVHIRPFKGHIATDVELTVTTGSSPLAIALRDLGDEPVDNGWRRNDPTAEPVRTEPHSTVETNPWDTAAGLRLLEPPMTPAPGLEL